jgi:hypothetical protein
VVTAKHIHKPGRFYVLGTARNWGVADQWEEEELPFAQKWMRENNDKYCERAN